MNSRSRLIALGLALLLSACTPAPAPQPAAPPDTRAADEEAIRGLVKDWAAAAQSKDPVKFTSFYADDAVLLLEQTPTISGKTAISEAMGPMMQDPNFSLTFATTRVDVAMSGDLASEQGTFELRISDQTKKLVVTKGKYVVVWKKENGAWKVIVDAPISDPASNPEGKK